MLTVPVAVHLNCDLHIPDRVPPDHHLHDLHQMAGEANWTEVGRVGGRATLVDWNNFSMF